MEAAVLAGLLASDVALVISATERSRSVQGTGRSWPDPRSCCGPADARTARHSLDHRLAGHYEDIADHIVDVEPFHADDDPERAIARHILQVLVAGESRGSVRAQSRAPSRADGRRCDDVQDALTRLDRQLSPHLEAMADHIVDVEPFHADDDPGRAIARHIARLLAHDDARPADPA